GDAKRRQAGPLEPFFVRIEAVGLREVLDGRIVEGPHLALVEAAGAHGVEIDPGGSSLLDGDGAGYLWPGARASAGGRRVDGDVRRAGRSGRGTAGRHQDDEQEPSGEIHEANHQRSLFL